MQQNKVTKILVIIVLAISFLIASPLRDETITVLFTLLPFAPDFAYLLIEGLVYAALFICLYLVLKQYKGTVNILKMFGMGVGIAAVDCILALLAWNNELLALLYDIVKPAITVAMLLLAFRWIAKKKFALSKPLMISGGCIFVINVISHIAHHFYYKALMQNMGNGIFSLVDMLSASDGIFSILSSASFYALAFLSFLLMMDSLGAEE